VGRKEEGSSSNRPEIAAFVLALRGTPVTNPMLYLCDNQALLKASKRWVVEGGKATLVGAPDADILQKQSKSSEKEEPMCVCECLPFMYVFVGVQFVSSSCN